MLEKIPVERARGHPGGDACGCTDPDVIEGYLSDASGRKGAAEALFRPVDEAGVASVLRRAHREGAYVTVAAGQTSTTASSVPRGGWIVSTEKFQRMGAVDVQAQSARCEAGVILGAWQDDLLERGFLYPPDPTSRYECTVGGSVACNASGPRSHRFGATRRWVRGLRVVLACGEVLALRRGEHVASSGGGFEIVHGRQPGECALAEGVGRYESR
ncbi:MAG: FAD-binding oxidoreductase, partial [bacterium]|nr:FAD-binding oxidoreductase [bacterium]